MQLTLQQAADLTGKAKSTIQRAIKSGKLSATLNNDGNYSIDAAELSRVYVLQNATIKTQHLEQHATPNATDETEVLRVKLELTQMQLERERLTVDDLRERLDRAEQERRSLMNMLTHQPQQEPVAEQKPTGSKLRHKLFGF
jgi:hypothetical protein